MKNGHTPGADGISAGMLNLGGKKVAQLLVHLDHTIWEAEKVPDDWVKYLTVSLHKKGPQKNVTITGTLHCLVYQEECSVG